MFGKRFTRALVVATAATLIMASTAFADNAVADGDGVVPVANHDMSLGNVACDATTSKTALIAISRQGSATGTNTFADGAQVTISVTGVSGAGLSASISPAANAVTLPSNWTSLANNTLSGTVQSSVSINSSTAGAGAGSLEFRATGLNSGGQTISREVDMAVTWTTGSCAPTNTAPSVSVSGVSSGASYEHGSVPAAMCDVVDAEDGSSSFAATLSAISGTHAAFGLGSQTASCSYTDGGGLSDGDSVTYSIVDLTGPVVLAPADLTVEGNTLGGATQASVLAGLGSASAIDAVFGDVSASLTTSALPTVFPLGDTTITYTAVDGAGNTGSDSTDVTVVDTIAPTISGMPSDISTTTMNSGGKAVSWTAPTASDIVDGGRPAACLPASGSTFAIGTTTVTCSASDTSGNTAQSQFTVTVGLLSALWKEPINGPSVVNVAKAGRVIPVKVEVFLNGIENENTGAVTFKLYKSNACAAGAQDAIETFMAVGEAAGGDAFAWNTDGGFYQYNLKTPSTAGCYSGEVLFNGERAGYFLINAQK